MVAETSAPGVTESLYAVNAEMHWNLVVSHEWLRENVVPHLPTDSLGEHPVNSNPEDSPLFNHIALRYDHPDVKPRFQIANDVRSFLSRFENPQLRAWYGAYDHVIYAQLFGRMIDLPKGFPMWTYELKQEAERLGNPSVPKQDPLKEHHALFDAQHDRDIELFLNELARDQARGLVEKVSASTRVFPPTSKPAETDGKSVLDALHTVDTEDL
jgi:hypothetical protein